jgi:signal transduction histidine kinase/ActR/RegA family two-component response regulator
MNELTPVVGAQHGAFYMCEDHTLQLASTYAHSRRRQLANRFAFGEGLVGQCAREKKPIIVTEVPEGYVEIASGLGHAPPRSIAVYPVLFENEVRGVIELGSFREFTPIQLAFLEQLMLSVGMATNMIGTNMRTEQLLQQLQGSNVELDKRRTELEERAQLLEARNREIAEASASLEAKSGELARVSQYKSQFLANMSHEIRTPLNSMMLLAQMLSANEDKNLSGKQEEWAAMIHSAGRDLLALINQVLDLSKVEAGRIETHLEPYPLADLRTFIDRTFRPVALQRALDFTIELGPDAPASLTTDRQLLEQILKNLISNAFKFTEHGHVGLHIARAPSGHVFANAALQRAPSVLAFRVSDTGIGIEPDQLDRIFDAFQQADASVTRKYGGTGLGLAISREYARMLNGEIAVQSTLQVGSTFTLYLPLAARDVAGATPSKPLAPPAPARPLTPDELRALEGKKILIVEDDARNLYAETAVLERQGASVYTAANAREAYAKLREHPDVAVVLMDIMMPEIDGYHATREIRKQPEHATLPIIALTAKASEADREQALAAGCTDFLVKPAEARQLVSTIVRAVRPR